MSRHRLVVCLLLMPAGVLPWTVIGVRMMLTVAHGAWGSAILLCMGTAVATGLRYAGWTLLTFRDPLQDLASAQPARPAPPVPQPEAPRPAPRRD